MRPTFRWMAGITTFCVGIAILTLPPNPDVAGFAPGHYAFGGFLILCSFACAMPIAPVCRAVAAGCAVLSFLLAAFILPQIARDFPHIYTLETVELLFLTCVIGAGTAWYALTGKLPPWLWIIVHRFPRRDQ